MEVWKLCGWRGCGSGGVDQGLTHTHTPSQEMQDNYSFLLRVYDRVVEKLCEGVRLCDVYTAALQLVETERPDLKDHFTRNVGYVRCHAPLSVRVLIYYFI